MTSTEVAPYAGSRARSVVFALTGIFTSIALTLGVIELAARHILDDGMHFDLEMWKYARELKRVSSNPDIGHEHRPRTSSILMGVPVRINSIGLRDREYQVQKPPETVRVLMLGDSLTFGWGVKDNETPSKLLEASLNAGLARPRFEVINAGVGNYNTQMEVAYFLDRGNQLQPDVVVLNYFINDAEPTPMRRTNVAAEYSFALVMLMGAIDSVAREYVGKADWRTYYRGLYAKERAGWGAARRALARLSEFCRERNIGLLVANYPELHQLGIYPFVEVTALIEQAARSVGVDFVDLLPAVQTAEPRSLWVSSTDAHPNVTANRQYARHLHSTLASRYPSLFQKPP